MQHHTCIHAHNTVKIDTDGNQHAQHERGAPRLLCHYINTIVIKFIVKNIGSLRVQHQVLHTAPGKNPFDMDDEDGQWLNIPLLPRVALFEQSLPLPLPPPKSLSSTFIKIVDSSYMVDQHLVCSSTASPLVTMQSTPMPIPLACIHLYMMQHLTSHPHPWPL